MPRAVRCSEGGGAVSYERGTPVHATRIGSFSSVCTGKARPWPGFGSHVPCPDIRAIWIYSTFGSGGEDEAWTRSLEQDKHVSRKTAMVISLISLGWRAPLGRLHASEIGSFSSVCTGKSRPWPGDPDDLDASNLWQRRRRYACIRLSRRARNLLSHRWCGALRRGVPGPDMGSRVSGADIWAIWTRVASGSGFW